MEEIFSPYPVFKSGPNLPEKVGAEERCGSCAGKINGEFGRLEKRNIIGNAFVVWLVEKYLKGRSVGEGS